MNYSEEELNFIKKYKNLVGRDYQTRFLDLNEQALLKYLDKDVEFFGIWGSWKKSSKYTWLL